MKISLPAFALLVACLIAGCSETNKDIDNASDVREFASEDTAVMYGENNTMADAATETEEDFRDINFNAPEVEEAELRNAGVRVRGAANYRIYSVGEEILFETDKAEIRDSGEEKLQAIADAIRERNREGTVRVYGFTDSRASAAYNKELGLERARSVENWLKNNSELDTSRMRVASMGQQFPEATNQTPEGRQQNRRVEIVVVDRIPKQ